MTRAEVLAAMDKMKLENAPTLAPVMKEWTLAIIDKNFDKAWGLMSISTHELFTQQLEMLYKSLESGVLSMETALDNPNLPEENKTEMRKQYEEIKKTFEELKAMEGDGKKFFAWAMRRAEEMEGGVAEEIAKGKIEIISESIDGNTGYMVSKDLKTNEEEKLYFAQEKDGWKVDLTTHVEEGAE